MKRKENEIDPFILKHSSKHLGLNEELILKIFFSECVELCIRVLFLARRIGISKPMGLDIELLRP